MNIAVVGLGGIGGYLCASLSKTQHNVVGFARGVHLKKIQTDGLRIVEDSNSWSVKVNAQELEGYRGCFDVVLFCVKSYDLEESYKKIAPSIDSNTTILSFSNGVNNGDILRKLSDSTVLDGCIYILSHIEEAGVIRKKGKVFASVFGGDETATKILSKVFEEANLRCKTPTDIKTAIWKKYIFISAFATITSYYDKTIGYVYEHHKDEVKELLEEIGNVAKAKNIEILDEVEKALQTASKLPYDSATSMYLDFKNRKKVELESLSGFVVIEGKKYGVKTPVMEMMYDSLVKR